MNKIFNYFLINALYVIYYVFEKSNTNNSTIIIIGKNTKIIPEYWIIFYIFIVQKFFVGYSFPANNFKYIYKKCN